MRRTISGWFLTATGFLACPCHLVITLPLAVALLSGTAIGGWIAGHQGAIVVGASLYFIGALAAGATLLLAGKSVQASTEGELTEGSSRPLRSTIGVDCCPPTRFPAALADEIPDTPVDVAPVDVTGGRGNAEVLHR